MGLKEYAAKRDFTKTPEPGPRRSTRAKGAGGAGRASKLRFVVQKHAASHLHYDFRLELDGVLKSWAVPKGPSLNPADKRLAMEVEDHPVSYGDFEGTIPKGQYGGGTVLLWDTGTWKPLDADPREALRRGQLKFELAGKKLRGSWALVRAFGRHRDERRNSWLLIKHKDDEASTQAAVTERMPRSVKTGRTLEEITADPDSDVHQSNRDEKKKVTGGAKTPRSARSRAAPRKPAAGSKKKAVRRTIRKGSSVAALRPPRSSPRAAGSRATVAPVELGAAEAPGARRASMPRRLRPQLCTLSDRVPEGDDWLHEIKFDGYRFLAYKAGRTVRLASRRDHDWTAKFGPIAEAISRLPIGDAVLDGEAAVLDETGRTSFQALQQAIKARRFERLAFYVFDLLYADGCDLTRSPLLARKEILRRAIAADADPLIRYSDHIVGSGGAVRLNACRLGLEGVVSKRVDAPYTQARSLTWLKIKCGWRQEFIVVGYTDPEGARHGFGSLILGAHDEQGRLVHTGRVGTGFNDQLLRDLGLQLAGSARSRTPLDVMPPRDQVRGVHWVEPKLVVEVSFTEWTEDSRLRHPSFEGVREDKSPKDVRIERPVQERTAIDLGSVIAPAQGDEPGREPSKRRERGAKRHDPASEPPTEPRAETSRVHSRPSLTARSASQRPPAGRARRGKAAAVEVGGISISNPDRVLYPEIGLTKLALARYYDGVAEWMLPYVIERPLATVRCPDGREGQCFFQKHVHQIFTAPVRAMRVKEKEGYEDFISIDSRDGLIKLAQLGVLEIHPWGSRAPELEKPDVLTFDLDPAEDVEFGAVKAAARQVKEMLEGVGLESFLKTSGGKGLHVVVPLTPEAGWDLAREFAEAVARRLAVDHPDKYVANMSKAKRTGKIFVDYLRNGRGATSIAPYSSRARPNAPVSMPIAWTDLARLKSSAQYTVPEVLTRLRKRKTDPWAAMLKSGQKLPALG